MLISAGQLVDGRGGAPVADAGVLVDATGMISWAGPMAQAPQLPGARACSGNVAAATPSRPAACSPAAQPPRRRSIADVPAKRLVALVQHVAQRVRITGRRRDTPPEQAAQ